jgi:hypothetical protein
MSEAQISDHIWCQNCASIQICLRDDLPGRDTTGCYEGIDLVCDECRLIVATLWRLPQATPEREAGR